MADTPEFKMSQDYELVPPTKGKAYPILITEWNIIKDGINKIDDQTNMFHTIGSIVLGFGLSTIISAFIYEQPNPATVSSNTKLIIIWAAAIVTTIIGTTFLVFGKKKKDLIEYSKTQVTSLIKMIEDRFKAPEA